MAETVMTYSTVFTILPQDIQGPADRPCSFCCHLHVGVEHTAVNQQTPKQDFVVVLVLPHPPPPHTPNSFINGVTAAFLFLPGLFATPLRPPENIGNSLLVIKRLNGVSPMFPYPF